MKTTCIALLFFASINSLFAQDTVNTSQLMETLLRMQQDTGKIFYSEKMNTRFLENLDTVLLKAIRISSDKSNPYYPFTGLADIRSYTSLETSLITCGSCCTLLPFVITV